MSEFPGSDQSCWRDKKAEACRDALCHRSREHDSSDPVNASQRSSVTCLFGDRSRELACVMEPAALFFFFSTGQFAALFIRPHDALQTRLLYLDGPCCAVPKLAAEKQVNANRTPTPLPLHRTPPSLSLLIISTALDIWKCESLYSYGHPSCSCMDSNSITSKARVSLVAVTTRHLIYLL